MAQFLTTHTAAAEIESLIVRARERLVLVSPFLKLSQLFTERLRDAAARGVRITIVYGKADLAPDQHALVVTLVGSRLLFLPNLHAKCYFNEARMVITSMNMYEFSEKSNREMGVLLEADEVAYQEAVAEVNSIISAAKAESPRGRPAASVHEFPQLRTTDVHRTARPGAAGNCIRCGRRVPLSPDRPLCREDFEVWAVYENVDYPEAFCHACGRPADTSMRRPLCYSCFRALEAR